jgi:hypothetical protein
VLYLARRDDPERHRGLVVAVEESVFAPTADAVAYRRLGSLSGPAFALGYRERLRGLRAADPALFRDLVALARAGDVTLVDGWGDDEWAPRRILAGFLKRVAWEQRQEARLRANRGDRQPRGA